MVVITAYPTKEMFARARELGAGDILVKPVALNQAAAALGELPPPAGASRTTRARCCCDGKEESVEIQKVESGSPDRGAGADCILLYHFLPSCFRLPSASPPLRHSPACSAPRNIP